MAIGVTIPAVSAQTIPARMSGLRSLISSFFESTEAQPKYKNNWNEPINQDVKGLFCMYYQNVHGIPRNDVNLLQDLQAVVEYDVSCFCLSETNLDRNRPYIQSEYLARQRKTWKYSATSFSLINMESSLDYVTGGMLTSMVDRWSSRVFKKDSDPSGMGCWSYQTLVGKPKLQDYDYHWVSVYTTQVETAMHGHSSLSLWRTVNPRQPRILTVYHRPDCFY